MEDKKNKEGQHINVELYMEDKDVIDKVIEEIGIELFANVILEIDIKEVIESYTDDRRLRILKKLLEVMEIKKVDNIDLLIDVHQLIVNK